MVKMHEPVPAHAPVHPVKVAFPFGLGDSVTTAPGAKAAAQTFPQLIPAGNDVTVPPPVPDFVTVNADELGVNVATTDRACAMATMQVPVPEHPSPDHPLNVEVALGAAVSVTDVPTSYVAEHVTPHWMPAGDEDTVPPPAPLQPTESRYVVLAKTAVISLAWVIEMVHVPAPGHSAAPGQPMKVDVASAVAVSVMVLPASTCAEQADPQSIPDGEDETVPLPVPERNTLRDRVALANAAATEWA